MDLYAGTTALFRRKSGVCGLQVNRPFLGDVDVAASIKETMTGTKVPLACQLLSISACGDSGHGQKSRESNEAFLAPGAGV